MGIHWNGRTYRNFISWLQDHDNYRTPSYSSQEKRIQKSSNAALVSLMYRFPRGKTVTVVRSIAQGNVSQPRPLGHTLAWSIYYNSSHFNSRSAEIMQVICPHYSSYYAVVFIFIFPFSLKNHRHVLGGGRDKKPQT